MNIFIQSKSLSATAIAVFMTLIHPQPSMGAYDYKLPWLKQAIVSFTEINYDGAWILPYTEKTNEEDNVEKWVLLGRETCGPDELTWDAFGGKKDKNEHHPAITAAREFAEEFMTEQTMHLGFNTVRKYIDLTPESKTEYVIATASGFPHPRYAIMYVVWFDKTLLEPAADLFESARKKAGSNKNKEKDRVGWVRWEDLKDAILDSPTDTDIAITVYKPNNANELQPYYKTQLRPFFVRQIRPLLEDQSYAEGDDPKIRFY